MENKHERVCVEFFHMLSLHPVHKKVLCFSISNKQYNVFTAKLVYIQGSKMHPSLSSYPRQGRGVGSMSQAGYTLDGSPVCPRGGSKFSFSRNPERTFYNVLFTFSK